MQYLDSSSKIKPTYFTAHIFHNSISFRLGQDKEYCIKMMILIPKYILRAHVILYSPPPLSFSPLSDRMQNHQADNPVCVA